MPAWTARLIAIISKEFLQMRRDFSSIAMLLMIPLIQILIFGYAINTNPQHLPTATVIADHSEFTRRFITAIENTNYFQITAPNISADKAQALLAENKVQFIIAIPPNFTRDLLRGLQPQVLVEADSTDPVATSGAISALQQLLPDVFSHEWRGVYATLLPGKSAVDLRVHQRYNPGLITQYNIVPALLGVVLTLSMVMITAMAITREYELGTMENLLATPLKPLEVIIGKVTPYLLVGYGQMLIILTLAYSLFHVPMRGSILLLLLAALPFILANLAVGLTLSTLAKNQLQANTSSVFFFLPSILLSGFLFPFFGMPHWAQYLGQCLPLTYFLRIVRGILLKGNGWIEVWPNLWPILVIVVITMGIAWLRYRRTLD